MKSTVRIEGGKKLQKILDNAGKGGVESVSVGFFSTARYANGMHVAFVAALNEFGTRKRDGSVHIPERPFFRNAIKKSENDVIQMLFNNVDPRRMVVTEQIANMIGAKVQGNIQQEIADLKRPGNAPATIERKGFDNPLIHTGHMRRSVTYRVKR